MLLPCDQCLIGAGCDHSQRCTLSDQTKYCTKNVKCEQYSYIVLLWTLKKVHRRCRLWSTTVHHGTSSERGILISFPRWYSLMLITCAFSIGRVWEASGADQSSCLHPLQLGGTTRCLGHDEENVVDPLDNLDVSKKFLPAPPKKLMWGPVEKSNITLQFICGLFVTECVHWSVEFWSLGRNYARPGGSQPTIIQIPRQISKSLLKNLWSARRNLQI